MDRPPSSKSTLLSSLPDPSPDPRPPLFLCRTPKPSSALEIEAHRLHRLVKILSARCATREALLATQLGRAPRPVPTLADVPIPLPVQLPPLPKSSKRGKQQADKSQRGGGGGGGGGEQQQPRDDIVVDFQAYNDYCNRHSANQESILEDAQALLSLAADPVKSGTDSPFFVNDNGHPTRQGSGSGIGVGLEISAAAALAAAQAARQPRPFSQFTTKSAVPAKRPPLPRSATTSALHGGVPTTQLAAPNDGSSSSSSNAAVISATQIEAYRSLAAQMGLDLYAAGGGSPDPDPYDGTDQAFDSSAFEPVMESAMLQLPPPPPPPPLYYLPPPVFSSAASAAETTRSTSTATFFYPTLGSSSSSQTDSNAAAPGPGFGRRRQDPEWLSEREARHRARFDRAANEALATQVQDEQSVLKKNGSRGLFQSQGEGYGRTHNNNAGDDDPMLLAPIETTRTLPPQLPLPPRRRSSWLLSPPPFLDPLSLPVPPSACSSSSSSMQQQQQQQQQRPHLSIDAAGAFAQTFREANPLSGSGTGASASGGGAISALFWRGLPSAVVVPTPLRSTFATGGATPLFGPSSKNRLWQDVVVDSPDRDQDDDDDEDDERFEPRPAGGLNAAAAAADHSLMTMVSLNGGGGGGGGGGEGVLDEWERFQPRAANQTERTAADLTVVEEPEPAEPEEGQQQEQEEEEGGGGGGEEPRVDGSAAAGAAAAAEEEERRVASGESPQTTAAAAAAVSVGAMDAEAVAGEGSVEVAVAVAVDGGGGGGGSESTAATAGGGK